MKVITFKTKSNEEKMEVYQQKKNNNLKDL